MQLVPAAAAGVVVVLVVLQLLMVSKVCAGSLCLFGPGFHLVAATALVLQLLLAIAASAPGAAAEVVVPF